MRTSERGIELIKEHEGFVPEVYPDPVGKDTIGYGTLLEGSEKWDYAGRRISKKEGEKLLRKHLREEVEPAIQRFVRRDLNQNQFDALASLIYNIGSGNFRDSRLLRLINKKAPEARIRREWMKWDKAGGKRLKGLVKRREEEADLFFEPALVGKVHNNWKTVVPILLTAIVLFIIFTYK